TPAPTQIYALLTRGDLTDPEKLILIAQKHFATGFPNERRVGCPEPDVIQAARADQMPDDELRDHLFRCSECFDEYREAIRVHYRQPDSGAAAADRREKLMDLLSRWGLPALAGATAVLLLAGGLSIWRRHQTATPQSSQNRPQHAPEASADNPLTPRLPAQPPEQKADPALEKPRLAGSLAINLDLNRRNALGDSNRGDASREAGTKIKLPRRRAVVKLLMHERGGAAFYLISIA